MGRSKLKFGGAGSLCGPCTPATVRTTVEGPSRRYVPRIRKWSPPVVGDRVMMLEMDGSIMGPSTDGAEFPQPTLLRYILNLAYIACSSASYTSISRQQLPSSTTQWLTVHPLSRGLCPRPLTATSMLYVPRRVAPSTPRSRDRQGFLQRASDAEGLSQDQGGTSDPAG